MAASGKGEVNAVDELSRGYRKQTPNNCLAQAPTPSAKLSDEFGKYAWSGAGGAAPHDSARCIDEPVEDETSDDELEEDKEERLKKERKAAEEKARKEREAKGKEDKNKKKNKKNKIQPTASRISGPSLPPAASTSGRRAATPAPALLLPQSPIPTGHRIFNQAQQATFKQQDDELAEQL